MQKLILILLIGYFSSFGLANTIKLEKATLTGASLMSELQAKRKKDAKLSAQIELKIFGAHRAEAKKKLHLLYERKDQKENFLFTFLSPAKIKGSKFLLKQGDNGRWEKWIKIRFRGIKKITGKDKCPSLFGSEFSCSDLMTNLMGTPSFVLQHRAKTESDFINVVQVLPGDRADSYTVHLSEKKKWPIKVIKMTPAGTFYKTYKFTNYMRIQDKWFVGKIEVKNHKSNRSSILIWNHRDTNVIISQGRFNPKEL